MHTLTSYRNHSRLSKSRRSSKLLLYLLALMGSSTAFAKYGDVMQVKGNSPLPPGWVVIDVTAPAMAMGSTGLAPTVSLATLSLTIRDIKGAQYGEVVQVRGNSPIPMGWVIIETLWPTTYSTGLGSPIPDHIAVHTLKYIIEPKTQEGPNMAP